MAPTADDSSARALVFGGYRWRNDIAVEASFNSIDQYALRPGYRRRSPGRRIELRLELRPGRARDPQLERRRVHELDVLPLVGALRSRRLRPERNHPGVRHGADLRGQAGARATASMSASGLRYDMNSSLGLRVEYARFGRFAGEIGATLPGYRPGQLRRADALLNGRRRKAGQPGLRQRTMRCPHRRRMSHPSAVRSCVTASAPPFRSSISPACARPSARPRSASKLHPKWTPSASLARLAGEAGRRVGDRARPGSRGAHRREP